MKKLFSRTKQLHTRRSHGFTIVEMLLYMGIFSILLVVLTEVFVEILNVRTESEAVSNVEQDSRYLLSRLRYDIQHATSIATPASLGSTASTLVLVNGGNTYTYALSNGALRITGPAGTDNLSSSGASISAMTFQRLGNIGGKETIKMQFTVSSATQRQSGAEVRVVNTTVGRR